SGSAASAAPASMMAKKNKKVVRMNGSILAYYTMKQRQMERQTARVPVPRMPVDRMDRMDGMDGMDAETLPACAR
ncbi:MAG TPA: hypothetical protein VM223_23470, partial [Planctomycetota bacterium]|nr:hypothetical protein [Planctomycetota bacterium]